MPAGPLHAPSSTPSSYKPDGGDFEPDDEWKAGLKKQIEENLSSMVQEAKDKQVAELEKNVVSPEDRMRLENEYKQAMANIKRFAQDQYSIELNREINQRRWMAGLPMSDGWSDFLQEEQRRIMDSIKQSGASVDNPLKLSNDSPSDERRPSVPNASLNEAPHVQVPVQTAPPSVPQHQEEREKVSSLPPSHTARRTSDTQSTVSRDRTERTPTARRKPAPSHERPTLPDTWVSPDVVDEPEEMVLRPTSSSTSSRSNRNSIDRPPPVTPDRHDSYGSLGRSSGSIRSERGIPHSPPKPEVWKPSITPSDEAPSPKPFAQIGRRPSSASMRSNGSGASLRPSITETIPERADDVEAIMEGEFVQRAYDHDKRKSTDKVREKEKRPNRRRDSRPSPVDPSLRHDEPPLSSSSMRSSGTSSATMQYAINPSSSKSLSSQPSFASADDRYHAERPSKPQPYIETRPDPRPPSRDSPYLHRELSYSVREGPPSARPVPTRSPYPDDRDYVAPYQPSSRPISTKPAFPSDRDYSHGSHPPISHKSSFTYDRRDREWDRERERELHWEEERERDLREREYARDRERERERERDIYTDSRSYPYSSRSSTGSYPTPPSSATRHASHDYLPMGDLYDDRDRDTGPPPRGYSYRSHAPPPLPPPPPLQQSFEEWEHPRESSRPLPSRQPSYRRDDHDRRMTSEIADTYPTRYVPPPGSIPIPRHPPTNDDAGPPAWTEWAAEGGGRRLSDAHRHETYARSPPPADHHPRHRSGHPPPKTYHDNPQPQPDSPTYASHDTRPRARARHKPVQYKYDDVGSESDNMVEDDTPPSEEESSGEEDDEDEEIEDEDEDGGEKEKEEENARLRHIELETKNLMAERMEAERKRKAHELEIQRLKEEEERLEQEAIKKQEEVRRKEEEMARLEEETRLREEEVKRKEEEVARKEEEERVEQERIRKEEEFKKKEQDAKKKELEAKRKVEAARKLEVEANKRAEEAKKKEADLKKKEEQTRRREEKLKAEAEQTKKLQMEAKKAAEEAEEKQEKLRKLEEETKKKEEEIREREQALYVREEELKRRESEAKKKEEEAMKKEEEKKQEERRKQEESKKQEAIKLQEEEEAKRKQEATKREEARIQAESDKRRLDEELKRQRLAEERRKQEALDDEFLNIDPKIKEEQEWILQQAKYERQAEQIRRNRAEERKRNDSFGADASWSVPHFPSSSPGASPGIAKSPPKPNGMSDRHSTDSNSTWNTSSGSAWSSSTAKPSTTPSVTVNKSSTGTLPSGKPRTGSVSSGTYPTSSSPHAPSGFSESEWARRQDGFINDQQEKFRREQEKMEAERQLRSAGRPLTREEIQEVFKQHERLHARLPKIKELTWTDFPWPLARAPSGPDDISMALVGAYFQSPWWPDKDKAKTPKDRIKEHLRRWHPDRFEVNSLPRVVESEKEKVKQGAGNVVRYLSDLLRKENENSSSVNIFGD